jgi:hypothetical protein
MRFSSETAVYVSIAPTVRNTLPTVAGERHISAGLVLWERGGIRSRVVGVAGVVGVAAWLWKNIVAGDAWLGARRYSVKSNIRVAGVVGVAAWLWENTVAGDAWLGAQQ